MARTLFLILFFATTAFAGEARITCTLPTENEDGSELTDLAGIRIYESTQSGGPYGRILDDPSGFDSSCDYVITGLPEGTHYFVGTAYNELRVESRYSDEASKEIIDTGVAPNAPADMAVTTSGVIAYTLSHGEDSFTLYQVGFVAEGATCDSSWSINGLYRVDTQYFIPATGVTIEPFTIWANCDAL